MNIELKPFLNILRRATHSGYPNVILNNRMLMQCYNLDVDSEVGLNYVLHIPDDQDPGSEFYDGTLVLNPREILKLYSTNHKELDELRKEKGLPPKASSETLEYEIHKHHTDLTFRFNLGGEEVSTAELEIRTDLPGMTILVENCAKSYDQLMGRIKNGGICLAFDGMRKDLQRRVVESSEIYWYRVRFQGKKLLIPFTKSMFLGIKELDRFYFTIQESTIDNIYVFAMSIEKRKIVEQFWGYLLQYQ